MARTELQRRRQQRETLEKMLATAREEHDDVRAARIVAGINETDELIGRLNLEAEQAESSGSRRGRR